MQSGDDGEGEGEGGGGGEGEGVPPPPPDVPPLPPAPSARQIRALSLTGMYKAEVLVWRLVICEVVWTRMSAWR